jgi:hypothetical protein
MAQTTIKAVTDCDYLVFLNKELQIIGYELSEDDRQAFQLRYHTPDECGISGKIPKGTEFYLELFGVNTTLVFVMSEEGARGELLFYRPSPTQMAKEVGINMESVVPLTTPRVGKEDVKLIPEKPMVDGNIASTSHIDDILRRVPYPNWMEESWGTPAWLAIWKNKPMLQIAMIEFSAARFKKQAKDAEECIYHTKGTCLANHGTVCQGTDCSDFELPLGGKSV